jgi:hypothetical protein
MNIDITNNIEELRQQWKSMSLRVATLEQDNVALMERLKQNKQKSLHQRLVSYRKRMMIISAVLPFVLAPLLVIYFGCKVPFAILYCAFFWIMSGVNAVIWRAMLAFDASTMTTEDALRWEYRIRRYWKRGRLLGCIMGLPVLVWLFSILYNIGDSWAIIGAWTGCVVGLVFGYMADYRQRALLKQLKREIEDSE